MFFIIIQFIFAVFLAVFMPILFLLLTPIFLYRYIVSKSVQYWSPSSGKILDARSTLMGVDDMSHPLWSLVFPVTVKGKGGFEALKKIFTERMVFVRNENGELIRPELQQYLRPRFGFLFWEWDKEFKIENHIHQNMDGFEYDVLNKEVVDKMAVSLIHKPYKPNRSPWEIIMLENYHDPGSDQDDEPSSIIFFRIHHAVGDGFSNFKILFGLVDNSTHQDSDISKYFNTLVKQLPATWCQRVGQFLAPIFTVVRIPWDVAGFGLDASIPAFNPWLLPERKLTRTINAAQTNALTVQAVKDLKNLCNCSFLAIMVEAYTGAIRKFMVGAGYKKIPSRVLCALPLAIPNHPNKMTNHMAAILVQLPTGLSDPLERLRVIDRNQQRIKRSTLPTAIFYSAYWVGCLFAWMVRLMLATRGITVLCSVFPGSSHLATGGGFTFTGVGFFGGMTRGNAGLGFNSLSYNNKLYIGVGIDEGLVPASKLPASKLLDYMIEEMEILKQAAHSKKRNENYAFTRTAAQHV